MHNFLFYVLVNTDVVVPVYIKVYHIILCWLLLFCCNLNYLHVLRIGILDLEYKKYLNLLIITGLGNIMHFLYLNSGLILVFYNYKLNDYII
ncbi:hypothetical protein Avbf_17426 [Armadillidium vulgare]|nr:hypothetical protein Avbf_17426 [Armadillidium vulgare]